MHSRHSKLLLILTSADGISRSGDPSTLVERVEKRPGVVEAISELQKHCEGSSREGAGGARSKLEFIKAPVRQGTTVIISNGNFSIKDALEGRCRRTVFQVR